jgi:flagellin
MSMRINQNVLSLSTYSSLTMASSRLENSISKLSSGLRINSAADDAAGLAISEKMRRQIRGLERAELNAQDGISMIQTAEGALTETQSIIQRMRELALQSANDTLTSNDRLEIQKEVEELKDQINSIAESTQFNTKKLLNGNQSALVTSSSGAIKGFVSGLVGSNGDYDIELSTVAGGISQMQRSQILKDQSGKLSSGSSKLEDIGSFYGASGNFALESSQVITLTGNGKSATITLDRQMTLNEVAASFQHALSSTGGLGISNSKVQVMTEALTGKTGDGGYLQITSGAIGSNGEFNIAGSQEVLDALGFSVTRESVNSMVSVSMKDAFGNAKTVTTSTDRASALLDGIDIEFKSQAAQIAGVGGFVSGLKLEGAEKFDIEVNGGKFTVNLVSGNWSMEGIARSINKQIEVANATGGAAEGKLQGLSAMVVEGEVRLNYNPAMPDDALGTAITISGANAETVGIYNGEYNGFVTGVKDASKSIEGIDAYDGGLKAAAKDALTKLTSAYGTAMAVVITVSNTPAYTLQAAPVISAILSNMSKVISANGSTASIKSAAKAATDVISAVKAASTNFAGASAAQIEEVAKAFENLGSVLGNTVVPPNADYSSEPTADVPAAQAAFADLVQSAVTAIRAEADARHGAEVNMQIADGQGDVATAAFNYKTFSSITVADMIEVNSFVAGVNAELSANDVDVRLDVVNSSFAFTSLQVGTELDGTKSTIKLDVTTGSALAQGFALNSATAYGSGDTAFRMHVVNTQAQLQIGADAGDNMKFGIGDMSTKALGLDKIDLTSVDGAEKSLEKLNQALDRVSSERSRLGAYQNRLEYSINNLRNTSTNLTSAESRIRDVDMAKEMIEYTRNQIVTQAGTSMLAQANAIPQNALSLLG